MVRVDAGGGRLDVLVDSGELLERPAAAAPAAVSTLGRGLFAPLRAMVGPADRGASIFAGPGDHVFPADHRFEPAGPGTRGENVIEDEELTA